MTLPYVRLNNLYFVPVVRQRLNFAVLTRRALAELPDWDDRDLIAVALPASVAPAVRTALKEGDRGGPVLPVSLIVSSWRDEHLTHEVFPVSPADALIEAVRFADERRLPLEWIDQELAPGSLRQRACLQAADWPDDGLALRWGAERYLDTVAGLVQQPPVRFEPVDTWREEHVADRLRQLCHHYRRVLVVCEATHVRPVCRLLRGPGRHLCISPEAAAGARLRAVRPTLAYVLRALDDFPRVVEKYEQERRAGRAANFDKMAAFFRCLQEGFGQPLSTRSLLAFRAYLQSLLEQNGRVCPRLPEVKEACLGCFGKGPTARVVAHLAGYGEQVEVERVREAEPGHGRRPPRYQIRAAVPSPEGAHVTRFCTPVPPAYRSA
jgi:hypothetical protein